MTHQMVVTGIGVFCPLGNTTEQLVESLKSGQTAIGEIQAFDASQLKIRHAAEILNYDPRLYFSESDSSRIDRTAQFGILAARHALTDSGLERSAIESPELGFVVGICAGGQGDPPCEQENPFDIRLDDFPDTAIFVQAEAIVTNLGLHGPSNAISTACASSGSALGVALAWLRTGRCRRVLVGGTDALSIPTYAGFYALGAMAPQPMSPFSEGIGVSFGEGAGFVVIERLEDAEKRGAKIYGELMGCGMSGDAHHVTSPHPGGEGLNRAIREALDQAGVTPSDVDYFNAHGTGTRDNDTAETQAIRELYDRVEDCPPVSSTKSYFGHTLGAAGILEFIVSLLASKEGFIPPTIQFQSPRNGCDLDYVPNQIRPTNVDLFVSNSAAFGGINASVVGGKVRRHGVRSAKRFDDIWITGTGVVSPIGCGNTEFFEGLIQGRSGIRPVERFDVAGLRCQHAGLVPEFNPRKLIPTLDTRRAETMNRYAMVACGLALQAADLNLREVDSTRMGLAMALTYGSISVQENFRESLLRDGLEKLSAKYFPSMVVSTIGGQVSQAFRLQGINTTIVAGVTAGLQAMAHAFELLRYDSRQERMCVVGSDEVGRFMFQVLDERSVTGVSNGDQFQLNAYADGHGIVLGEGGASLLLERASLASERKREPLARVRGYGATHDGAHFGEVDLQGIWLAIAIERALQDANLNASDIDWIVTHGRGVPAHDMRDIKALRSVFGHRCPPVSCLSGHVGVGGASIGLFSTIGAVLGMKQGIAFPTLSTSAESSEGFPLILNESRPGNYRNVLIIGSTEFGANTALILERMD